MPAHISHEVFAETVFRRAFDDPELLRIGAPYRVFGAQGPDFCLHSHRTKPTGLIFGQLLHHEAYGTFIRNLVQYGKRHGIGFRSPFGVFTAAFATHAILDRITHPFINFYSGWVSRDHPESDQYYNCHAFFERIIDVFVLKAYGGSGIIGYDFFSHVDCGEEMPAVLSDAVSEAIVDTFPMYSSRPKVQVRIENAYHDTRNFYIFTNPADRGNLRTAYRREHDRSKAPRRLLALFHPDKLPDLDYLNGARGEWNHPGIAEETHNESLFDLFDRAVESAVPVVRAVANAFDDSITPGELEAAVGNQNLSDGRDKKAMRKLGLVKPLPLQEVLRTFYIEVAKSD